MNNDQPVNNAGAPPSDRRRRRFRLVLALIIVASAAGGWHLWHTHTTAVPSVNLDGADPEVSAAITKARDGVLRDPQAPAAWGQLGRVLAAHRYLEEARATFAEAERLQPDEVRWPYFQGLMLAFKDDDAAVAHFQRAVGRRGDTAAVRFRLAETLTALGRSDEADEQYRLLHSTPVLAARAKLGQARLAYQRGDLGGARERLRTAADQPTTQKATHALLAEIAQHAGDSAAAARERAKATELPDDPDWADPFLDEIQREKVGREARLEYALGLGRESRKEEAAAALRELVKAYPDWDQAWLNYGRFLMENRALQPALEAIRVALRASPESVKGHFYAGLTQFQLGDAGAAATHFKEAVRLKPDHALASFNLGHCLLRLNDRPGALAAFREAVRSQPGMARAHTSMGELLAEQGDKADAVKELRLSLQLNPDDEAAKKLLSKLEPGK